MATAVIYTRVSTEDQKINGFSLQDQERKCREYCIRKGYEVIKHYEDNASAKTFDRPSFKQFLKDVKGKIIKPDFFIVIRVDRFSRNASATYEMYQQFTKWKIKLEFVEDSLDLKTPEDLLMFMIKASIPQVENLRRAANTKAGLRQGLREGRWMGRAPYGYDNNTRTKLLEVNHREAANVEYAFRMFAKGTYSAQQVRSMVAERGLKLSKQGFLNLLKNEIYTGLIHIPASENEPSLTVQGLHEPIVSTELFQEVKYILKKNENLTRDLQISLN